MRPHLPGVGRILLSRARTAPGLNARRFSANQSSNGEGLGIKRVVGGAGPDQRRLVDQTVRRREAAEAFPEDIRGAIDQIKAEMKQSAAESPDGKPSKEFIDFFSQLASQMKKVDVTAKQQQLDSPRSQDFRAMVIRRKGRQAEGTRYTHDELKEMFTLAQAGKTPPNIEPEAMKRLMEKYELIKSSDTLNSDIVH